MSAPDTWMIFDVESTGLHGQGFAVGWVVVQRWGLLGPTTLAEGIAVTLPEEEPSAWVRENVIPHLPPPTLFHCAEVRSAFWSAWEHWREQGAWLAGDVVWPVEARFLAACVADDQRRAEAGPYPLVDIASYRLTLGYDPLAEEERRPNELPPHNPLADARHSARLFMEALRLPRYE